MMADTVDDKDGVRSTFDGACIDPDDATSSNGKRADPAASPEEVSSLKTNGTHSYHPDVRKSMNTTTAAQGKRTISSLGSTRLLCFAVALDFMTMTVQVTMLGDFAVWCRGCASAD